MSTEGNTPLSTDALAKTDPRDIALPGVTLTARGAIVDRGCTFEKWEAALLIAERAQTGSQLWIGDLLNNGERRYGDDRFEQSLSIFTATHDTIRNWCYVARQTESVRNVTHGGLLGQLNYSYYREVAPLETEDQKRLLESAKPIEGGHPMSIKDLKAEVKIIRDRLAGSVNDLPIEGDSDRDKSESPPQADEDGVRDGVLAYGVEQIDRSIEYIAKQLDTYRQAQGIGEGHHYFAACRLALNGLIEDWQEWRDADG